MVGQPQLCGPFCLQLVGLVGQKGNEHQICTRVASEQICVAKLRESEQLTVNSEQRSCHSERSRGISGLKLMRMTPIIVNCEL